MTTAVRIGTSSIELVQGDITQQRIDAIVNAANSSLMGGGGVDGAIHRAGGPQILEECKQIRADQGKLPTGQAVATTAGKMHARWVIHTVGPRWKGGKASEPELLEGCYLGSLAVARELGARTIAFPSISTGIYGYPVHQAAPVALGAVARSLNDHGAIDTVRFVLFDDLSLQAYQQALTC